MGEGQIVNSLHAALKGPHPSCALRNPPSPHSVEKGHQFEQVPSPLKMEKVDCAPAQDG